MTPKEGQVGEEVLSRNQKPPWKAKQGNVLHCLQIHISGVGLWSLNIFAWDTHTYTYWHRAGADLTEKVTKLEFGANRPRCLVQFVVSLYELCR